MTEKSKGKPVAYYKTDVTFPGIDSFRHEPAYTLKGNRVRKRAKGGFRFHVRMLLNLAWGFKDGNTGYLAEDGIRSYPLAEKLGKPLEDAHHNLSKSTIRTFLMAVYKDGSTEIVRQV